MTSKIETLSVSNGALQSDGETIFSFLAPLVLTLPNTAAVDFRFEFNVVDDRKYGVKLHAWIPPLLLPETSAASAARPATAK